MPRPEPPRSTPPVVEPPPPRPVREPDFSAPPPSPTARERLVRHDPLSGLAEELGRVDSSSEPENFEPPPRPPRREPRLRPVPPDPTGSGPASHGRLTSPADQNLADMAQRLEAALRRPNQKDDAGHPQPKPKPAQSAVSDEFAGAAPVDAPSPAPRPSAPTEASIPPREEPRPARGESKSAPPQRSLYDSLEQEMASLLGRSAGKG
jgi:flagellar protein FliO/FliZ